MGDAVAMRLRTELRRRWGTWLLFALVGAVAAGVVLTAVAGARRTDSAARRFYRDHLASDAYVSNFPDPGAAIIDPDVIEALPMVEASARAFHSYVQVGNDYVVLWLPTRRGFDAPVNVPRILEGRPPDPDRPEEVTISRDLADVEGVAVGDRIPFAPPEFSDLPQQADLTTEYVVVGIEARPGELGQARPPSLAVHGTPALREELSATHSLEQQVDDVTVRLRRGPADVSAFLAALNTHVGPNQYLGAQVDTAVFDNLRRANRLQAIALWLVAAVSAAVGIVIITLLYSRAADSGRRERRVLSGLGWTRRQTLAVAAWRGLAIGVVAGVGAAILALVLSPLAPIGLARAAEPHPGLAVDWAVLAPGPALAAMVLTAASVAGTAWALGSGARSGSPGGVIGRVTFSLPTSAALGARFAARTDARTDARVPARSAIGVLVIGVAALAAGACFVAGGRRLLDTPRLYGWSWDLVATDWGESGNLDPASDQGVAALAELPGATAIAVGDGIPLEVDGIPAGAVIADVMRGDPAAVLPPLTAGRLPLSPAEVALGKKTMQRAGVGIGDEVELAIGGFGSTTATVVGQVVLPQLHVEGGIGGNEGALVPNQWLHDALGVDPADTGGSPIVFLALEPGTDRQTVLADVSRRLDDSPENGGWYEIFPSEPTDLVNFSRTRSLPLVLGGLILLLTLATLVYTLVTAAHERRRDMATLKALGLGAGGVRRVLGWQATFLTSAGLVIGIPLGVVVGVWAWTAYVKRLGLVSSPAIPVALLGVGAVAAVLVAWAAAVWPGHVAAATAPATALRRE
jgi:ABC-type lipoprotein release transport system permease subunit